MRDYTSPEYKKFRRLVRNRDKQCRWPNCSRKRKLEVHHILTWADAPHLRYNINNGITLCKKHHKAIYGKENCYVEMFFKILRG